MGNRSQICGASPVIRDICRKIAKQVFAAVLFSQRRRCRQIYRHVHY